MNREQFLKTLIESRYPNVKIFSEKIGLPYTTVRSILERGVGNARVDNVIKICKGLGISPEDLSSDFKTNEIIADTLTMMIGLEESRQKNIYTYTKEQLAEQKKSKVVEISSPAEDDYNDPTMVIAAHMDDDFTEEEMEEVLRFIEFAKSKRKK